MPIFEYRCLACGKKFAALVGVVAHNANPSCPRCGKNGESLRKSVSRFARIRSEDDRMEQLAEDADQINPDDPRAVRELLGGMGGDDMDAGDVEQIMDEAMETNGSPDPMKE